MREAYDELAPISIFAHDDRILHATLRSFLTELKTAENEANLEAFVRRKRHMEHEWRGGERSPTNITAETFVAESVKEERLVPSYKYTHMFSLLLTTFLKTSVRARQRPSDLTRRDPTSFPDGA